MPNTTLTARFVSKPNNLHDLNARAAEARPQPTRIKEVVELTVFEFDAFTSNFFAITPWLAGKGGGMALIDAVEVRAPDRPRLLVNPEGYDYARYVALLDTALPDAQSEGTRALESRAFAMITALPTAELTAIASGAIDVPAIIENI